MIAGLCRFSVPLLLRPLIALRPDIAATLALTAVGFAATFTVIAYIQPVAFRIMGIDGAGIGGLQALIGVGSIFGVFIGGRYADRPNAMRMVAATFLVSILALSGYSWLTRLGADHPLTLPLLIASMVTGAAALFARSPAIQTRLIGLDPPSANVLLALNGSMVFAGQGLGAAIGAITIYALDVSFLGFAAAMVAAGGTLLALSLTAKQRRLVA